MRNLKEKRTVGPIKWRCIVASGDEVPFGLELMEEGDDHGNLTNAMTAPQRLTGLIQMHSVIACQLRWAMRKHTRDMLELKASIQSLKDAMQTFKDCIVGKMMNLVLSENIDHDIDGAEGDNVNHVDDVVDDVVAGDFRLKKTMFLKLMQLLRQLWERMGNLNQFRLKENMFLKPIQLLRRLREGMKTLNQFRLKETMILNALLKVAPHGCCGSN
ncbi:Uncharacterized protein TCM_012387 [Theobroma cacao]|uniref:Uncharacterized protein n=1 Tax=Theobroma cacao TaxID=3641 RepID=A0A061FW26_THECC|nr:Uncharacterized protein TCM_012387 [Theobroma cacao]